MFDPFQQRASDQTGINTRHILRPSTKLRCSPLQFAPRIKLFNGTGKRARPDGRRIEGATTTVHEIGPPIGQRKRECDCFNTGLQRIIRDIHDGRGDDIVIADTGYKLTAGMTNRFVKIIDDGKIRTRTNVDDFVKKTTLPQSVEQAVVGSTIRDYDLALVSQRHTSVDSPTSILSAVLSRNNN
ncbi:hypothetical protein ASC93_17930 [Massilia sp. Root335]|nr:hypothetical protein ASC93_17930 [Massilia sp. Root335]